MSRSSETYVEPPTKSRSELFAVVAAGVAFFMIVLDTSIVNLALPRIREVFHADLSSLQWLVDGYALVFASLLLNAGALGDRYGAKRIFTLGLIVFCAASAACGLAPSLASLQIARAVQGVSAAMLLPNSLAALNHTIKDPSRRKLAVSAWSSAGGLGIAVGPVIGGVLVQYFDWRSIFLVNIPFGLGGLWLARRHLAAGSQHSHREFDPVGQVLAVAILAVLTYWMIGIGRPHPSLPLLAWVGAVVVLLAIAFLAIEARQIRPMLPLDLLFRPALGAVAVVGLLHNVGIYGLIFALSLAFQELRGMTPVGAGLLFLPMTLALALGAGFGAKLLKASNPFAPQIWGHAASTVGAVALAIMGFERGLIAIAVPLCVVGLGGGATTPSMNLSALDAVERERSGLASGILNSARQTGGVIGVALLGALDWRPGDGDGRQMRRPRSGCCALWRFGPCGRDRAKARFLGSPVNTQTKGAGSAVGDRRSRSRSVLACGVAVALALASGIAQARAPSSGPAAGPDVAQAFSEKTLRSETMTDNTTPNAASTSALSSASSAPIPSTQMTTTYHKVDIGGVGVFYREAGPRGAPTIVLLHGFPSSSRGFATLIPLLATRYHVIAPDYPGFGESDAPPPAQYTYTFDHLAQTIDGLLDHLKVARYSLYIFDYGAPVGYRLMLAHPERLQALVVQNGNAYDEGLGPKWAKIAEFWSEPKAHPEVVDAFLSYEGTKQRHLAGTSHPDAYDPDSWNAEFAHLSQPGQREIQAALLYDYRTNVAAYPAWQAWLREHRPPTLIVWGANDPSFIAAGGEAYRRDVPDAEIHLLDAGHFALEEKNDEIARLILAFIDRLSPPAS